MPFEAFPVACRHGVEDESSPSELFAVVLGYSFLDASQVSKIYISEAFEILSSRVVDHSDVCYYPARRKLCLYLLLLNIVGQIFNEEHLASDRH